MHRYADKNVVITGGASGIGFATAKLLVDEGASVLITGRSRTTLEQAQREVGAPLLTLVSDASSLSDINALSTHVEKHFGTVDLLVANAGVGGYAPLEAVTQETFDNIMAVNMRGPFFTVQRLAPAIVSGGAIVFTTSAANVLGMPSLSVYSASKAALRSMVRTLARELLSKNIRVNAVSPGATDTGILDKMMDTEAAAQAKRQMTEENPMKRFARPEEVAAAIAFLGFEATYTTGAELAVDGGGSQL